MGELVLLVVLLCFAGLWLRPHLADAIIMAALSILIVSGAVSVERALSGFSNPGVLTIAALFLVAAGLRDSGAMHILGTRLLRTPNSERHALLLLTGQVSALSAFINNTPLVALYLPMVQDWARRHRLSPSQLLMPMSFAAIAGGACTLIGSSTNLVANSVLVEAQPGKGLSFFEPALLAIPVLLTVVVYLLLMSPKLPKRIAVTTQLESLRRYSIEMQVIANGIIAGRTVTQAGLRQLDGFYLAELVRENDVIAPVDPETRLRSGDHLLFVGDPSKASELMRIPGISPITDHLFENSAKTRDRHLVEVVVSQQSPLIGLRVKDSDFRAIYDAAILAIARDGQHLNGKIGNRVLEPGDTLLLDTNIEFSRRWSDSRDFLLIRPLDHEPMPRIKRPMVALAIVGLMLIGDLVEVCTPLGGALMAAGALILSGCLSIPAARKSTDLSIIIVIAGSIGLGQAMEQSGIIAPLAHAIINLAGTSPIVVTAVIFLICAVITTFVSNAAAVALIMPLALSAGTMAGLSSHGITMTVIIGASASFASPMAYQTNLMVMGPAGYTFGDYVKFGLPLVLLVGIVTTIVAPLVY